MIVDELLRLGFVGVGQSSWGPTLYGFCSHSSDDMSTAVENLRKRLGLDESSVFWTKADNQGAELLVVESAIQPFKASSISIKFAPACPSVEMRLRIAD